MDKRAKIQSGTIQPPENDARAGSDAGIRDDGRRVADAGTTRKKPRQHAIDTTSSKTSLIRRSIFRRGVRRDGGEERRALKLGNGP